MAEKVITTLHSEDDTSKEIYPNILEDNIPQTFKDSINTKISNNTSSITEEKESRENLIHLEDTGEIAVGAIDHVVELVGTQINARSPIYTYNEVHVNEVKDIGDKVISIQSEDIDIVGSITVDSSHIVSLKNINNLGANHDINIVSNNANLQLEGTQVNVVGNFSVNGNAMATQGKLVEEASSRATADTQIQTNLSKEIQERKEQDTSLQNNIDKKQDKLTAGIGIEINDNVISTTFFHTSTFHFSGTSGKVTSVDGEASVAFNSSTNEIDITKLMTIYPYNEIKFKQVQLQDSTGANLDGLDDFIFFPNCYMKTSVDEDEQGWNITFSSIKVDNTYSRAIEDDTRPYLGLGCYKASLVGNYLRSVTGNYPAVYMSNESADSKLPYYNGSKIESQDWRIRMSLVNNLVACALGNRNTQEKLNGIVDYYWSKKTVEGDVGESGKSGYTNDALGTGVVTGEITALSDGTALENGKRPFKVLGLENLWGLVYENVSGISNNLGVVKAYFGDGHIDKSSSLTGYKEISREDLPLAQESGWQLKFTTYANVFFPSSIGGDSSHGDGDYYYYGTGLRCFIVGGSWISDYRAGLFYLNCQFIWNYCGNSIGFRLSI